MGQQEVLDFLRKHKDGWYCSKDIKKEVHINQSCIGMALRKLYYAKFIKQRIQHKNNNNREIKYYSYKG